MTDSKALKGVKSLLFTRGSLKKKITSTLEVMLDKDSLMDSYFQTQQNIVTKWLSEIDTANSKICEICEKADVDVETSGLMEPVKMESLFISQVFEKLSTIERRIVDTPTPPSALPVQNGVTDQQLYVHVLKIQCTKFSGEEVGKFAFKNFLSQFENCVTSVESKRTKLSILKGFLTGYASQYRVFLSKGTIMTSPLTYLKKTIWMYLS